MSDDIKEPSEIKGQSPKNSAVSIAGKSLTKWLREIGQEETELIKDDGEDRLGTKAEALARLIWKKALGYKKIVIKTGKELQVRPDKTMIATVLNRLDGRIPMTETGKEGKKAGMADRVKDQTRQRLNKLSSL